MIRPVRVILGGFRDYFRDGGMMYAAALAFFIITAIVPLCLFLMALFGYLLGEHEQFLRFFTDKLVSLFPAITTGILKELQKLITYKGVGKMSIILYAFLSFPLYQALHKSMEAIFKVRDVRSFLWSFLLAIAIVTMLVSLLLLSFALSAALPVIVNSFKETVPWLRLGKITSTLIRFVLPLLLVQFAAVIIYMLLPKRKVKFANAFWGGLFTAIMLELAKHLFTWYVKNIAHLGTVYGSLATFIIFLLWTFYSSSIFLIGGEITHILGDRREEFFPRRRITDI